MKTCVDKVYVVFARYYFRPDVQTNAKKKPVFISQEQCSFYMLDLILQNEKGKCKCLLRGLVMPLKKSKRKMSSTDSMRKM